MKALTVIELAYKKDSSEYFEYFRHLPLASFIDSCAVDYNGNHSRYDVITALPSDVITVRHDAVIVWEDCLNQTVKYKGKGKPFEVLSQLLTSIATIDDCRFPFTGGVLGYWSYELGTLLEPKLAPYDTPNEPPLMCVGLFRWALVTDHEDKKTSLLFHPDIDSNTKKSITQSLHICKKPLLNDFKLTKNFTATISFDQYQYAFDRIQDYILAGDCYQVNLTQQFTATYAGDNWQAYRRLRQVNPAPYAAYLAYPDVNILSLSPEKFIQVTEKKVETRPIKGTIARGRTPEEDEKNAKLLLDSEKDHAENLMIVDLLRNDLGKICETGSIQVPQLCGLESYANVHHLVSAVTGKLPDKLDVFQVMGAVFPGGSITGAPKIRAMEIIGKLEASARSVYCGSIGYASCNGRMDSSITIRTMAALGESLYCWGGGAIVADSSCRQEYEESLTKVKILMDALDQYSMASHARKST
ncbi:MAG: aminodeoxychorismate synthase component I [Endozoicomonas sp. (ex Botrylloides leachii)]|nr:aminodeoxychorismate synthase component I [Endozoicomonas sp. (ex Botrylloides leachii)]